MIFVRINWEDFDMTIRKLSIEDLALLTRLRVDFLLDEEAAFSESELIGLQQKCKEFFTAAFEANRFIAFAAEENGEVLSTAFLGIHEKPPRRAGVPFRMGTLYNVMTYKEHRRRGLATQVLKALFNEAKLVGIESVDLWATEEGKKLYETLGFFSINCTPMKINFE